MKNRFRWKRIVLSILALRIVFAGAAAAAAPERPARKGNTWPMTFHMGEAATITLEAPQAESLEGTKLKAHGELSVQRAGEANASPGTAWYEADVEVDRTRRSVRINSADVTKIDLPGSRPAFQNRLSARLGRALARTTLSLDDVLATIHMTRPGNATPPKLNTDPPRVVFATEPAILLSFDGEPRFRALDGSTLERALNTPFLVLRDPRGNVFYLDGGTSWFRAPDAKGPWTPSADVPSEAIQIARRDLREAGVADSEVEQAKQTADKRVPKILVATEPTELLVTDGPPRWSPVVAGELETISNSQDDVFRTVPDQRYWVVLSGRWYRSDGYSGPWTYVESDQLPASFRKIPGDSDKADVLAYIPGTAAAREALADAETPRTTPVRRSQAHVSVTYDGDPKFEAVPGTRVEYAVNTPQQVLKIGGRYFVCDNGIWFSGSAPNGSWAVADSIPEAEIQSIPPESPVYNTRFVSVYDATPDVVYEAYTPAYLGSYPYDGAVVFGTGWRYRPWWGSFYYPRFATWGFHARYAAWAGWGWGFGWGPAWGGFRYGFGFGWGARWCGPGAFFRPAFRNVNVARNVNVTRNVSVSRNLYHNGNTGSRSSASRSGAGSGSAGKSAPSGKGARPGAGARGKGSKPSKVGGRSKGGGKRP